MDLLERALPLLYDALVLTLFLGLTSYGIGSVIGLFGALARMSSSKPARYASAGFVAVFRGTPLLVQVLLIYFGLPQFGITIGAIPSAIIALAIHEGAYLTEIYRSGVLSVGAGQHEAAHSLSMNQTQTMRRVVLPQAVRIAVPPAGNRLITAMKDTSLASVITVQELTGVARTVGSATFRYVEMFVMIAVVYLIINTVLSAGVERLEKRLARPY